jgi:hypothetical protein
VRRPFTELPGIRGLNTDFGSAPLASLSSPVVDNITHRRSQYLDIHYIGTPEPTLVTHRLIPINASAPSRARPFAPWKNALTFHPVRPSLRGSRKTSIHLTPVLCPSLLQKEMLIAVGGITPTVSIIAPEFDKWQAESY